MKDEKEGRSSQLVRKESLKKFRFERCRCSALPVDHEADYQAPSCLDSSVGAAMHRHRRGHGFESRSSLNFFQAFFSHLLKLRTDCEDLFSISCSLGECIIS